MAYNCGVKYLANSVAKFRSRTHKQTKILDIEWIIPVKYGEVDEDDDAHRDPEGPGRRVDDVARVGGEHAGRALAGTRRVFPHLGPVVPPDQRGHAYLRDKTPQNVPSLSKFRGNCRLISGSINIT